MDETLPKCRLCDQEEGLLGNTVDGSELIRPCQCTGPYKWVHRRCLDQSRCLATSQTAPLFTHCPRCDLEYTIDIQPLTRQEEGARVRRFWFHLATATLGVFGVIQVIICALAGIVALSDQSNVLRDAMPVFLNGGSGNTVTTYYIYGLVLFLVLVATGSIFSWVYYGRMRFSRIGTSPPTSRLKQCRDVVLGFSLLVVLVVFVGVIVGFIVVALAVQSWLQRRARIYWLVGETKIQYVHDFAKDSSSSSLTTTVASNLTATAATTEWVPSFD